MTPVSVGTATVTVTATDRAGSDTSAAQTFAVTVGAPANRPPEAAGVLAPVTLEEGGSAASVEVSGAFRDPDGDVLTYGASSSSPSVAAVSVSASVVTVTPVSAGMATVTVTATDRAGSNTSAAQTFAVTVGARRVNRAPTPFGTIPRQTLAAGGSQNLGLAHYFHDPDGDPLTFAVSSSDDAAVAVSISGSTAVLRPIGAGTAAVAVTAQDPGGLTAMHSFDVSVASPTTERVLAALVDFLDVQDADRLFSRGEIVDLLVRNEDSLRRFVWESSRNLVELDFDVLDYVTVEKARTDYPLGGGDVIEDAVSAISYVADLSRYDKILLFITPLEQGYPGCAAYLVPEWWYTPNGAFELGAAWLSGYDMMCVSKGRIAHEFGHTFGFNHSYALSCPKELPVPASLIDPTDKNDSCRNYDCVDENCTETRPIDSFIFANSDMDMLGGDHLHRYENLFPLHYQATWQAHAGWLSTDQVTVAERSGRYWVTTLESLDARPKALRLPLGLNHRAEPHSYLLQTRVFSPWTNQFSLPADADRCQVDVRLSANRIFDFGYETDINHRLTPFHTYFFDGFGQEVVNGQWRAYRGESIVRRETPFWDPYRGVRMEIVDCVEEDAERTAIQVSIDYSRLRADPPIVSSFDDTGATGTIRVTNGGTVPVSAGSVEIGGRHPAAFALRTDGCSSKVLAPGASCGIEVSFVGDFYVEGTHYHALLKIPNDDELAPELSVSLLGR